MSKEERMKDFIVRHLEVVRPLSKECSLAWWENALTGSEEAAERAASLSAKLMKIYANKEDFAFLRGFSSVDFTDPYVARQHDLLLRGYQGEQMSDEMIDKMVSLNKEVEQEYNTFRANVRGASWTENDVKKVLLDSDDSELRKDAWIGSKAIGARVADRVVELVHLRNEVAKEQGFANHYSKIYALDELDEERVFRIFQELADLTTPAWMQWKQEFDAAQARRFGISVEELRPWHYPDPFFQEPPKSELNLDRLYEDKNLEDLTRRFYAAIGLPVDEILKRSDLYEKPGKNQHAFCTDIDREGDVRILCNIRPNDRWMGTMLHEFGHGVYDLYTDYSLPYILRGPSHTLATEAIAELMGRFATDGTWLGLYAGASEEESRAIDAVGRQETKVRYLILTRWFLTMSFFEREMYRNPDQDLNSLWWDTVEKFQGVKRPDHRNEPDWAAKIHLACAPVYYQNYLLGEMYAAQLLHYLSNEVLKGKPKEALFTSPEVGRWLKEKIFHQGNIRPWEEGLKFAMGEYLNPKYYAEQVK